MRYVRRQDWSHETWRALAAIGPTGELWIHHGASGTSTLATLRAYDRYHVRTRGWAGLGYSWAVTSDGTIYEGRGWRKAGAHTSGRNSVSHAIVLVGDWSSRTPPQAMVESVVAIVRDGVAKGALTRPVISGGHRDAPGASTSCPGAGGMRLIPAARALLAGPVEVPADDDLEDLMQGWSDQEKDDALAFFRALRAGDKPVSGHQAGTDVRRSTYGRRAVDGNPESDAEFLSTLRRDIGGRPTTLVHLANFYRRIAERTGLAGNNPTGNANRVQLRD